MELTRTKRLEPVADMTYLVSNSEAANFLSCEMKHYYAHILNLEPINASTSLSRGVIGHEAMAVFYETGSEEEMLNVVSGCMFNELQKSSYPGKEKVLTMLGELQTLLQRYVAFQEGDDWEILAVEKQYTLPLFDQYGYTMRLDLLVRFTKGPRAGEIWIVDHKFVYDFMNANALQVNAQIPKYVATVRKDTGLVITGGILNQVRHRLKKSPMTDAELFCREPIRPSAARIRNIMKEQIKASEKIIERHNMPVDEAKESALRVLNPMVCNNCPFFGPCMTDLEGESTKLMLEMDYKPNSYGYNGLGVDE